jgi:hypothetical protein
MNWTYEGADFEFENHPTAYGYVYIITHSESGKKYIGRKFFSAAKTKQVKGIKKKIRVESDWKEYWGSSPALKRLVEECGKEAFTREIVRLCYNRSSCSYFESKLIFQTDAIISDEYINDWISCRISSMHVKAIKRG